MSGHPPTATIRAATVDDLDQITSVLVEAFLDAPDGPWLIPDRGERRTVYQRFTHALAGYTLTRGHIDVTDTLTAAAIWFDHTQPTVDFAGYDRLRTTACAEHVDRFRLLDDTLAHHHPPQPHHYLAWLAVHPDHQCRGLGTALLAHRHTILDTTNQPAYLVATSSGARDLYLRHGYRLRRGTPFHLPAGPPMWGMWRHPHPTPAPAVGGAPR